MSKPIESFKKCIFLTLPLYLQVIYDRNIFDCILIHYINNSRPTFINIPAWNLENLINKTDTRFKIQMET